MFSSDDADLQRAFRNIISNESLTDYILDIAELVCIGEFNMININAILSQHNISSVNDIKNELLDVILFYINDVLKDGIIDEKEKKNIEVLKLHFKIKEGDFYKYKYNEIGNILHVEFQKLYFDNRISREEAKHNFKLRYIFDLSHSQFDKFKENEVLRALENGANITDLDTSIIPKKFKN